jgi:hypothetical protein
VYYAALFNTVICVEIIFPLMKRSDFGTVQVTDPSYHETVLYNFILIIAIKRTLIKL